jgi:hypothetical protein
MSPLKYLAGASRKPPPIKGGLKTPSPRSTKRDFDQRNSYRLSGNDMAGSDFVNYFWGPLGNCIRQILRPAIQLK